MVRAAASFPAPNPASFSLGPAQSSKSPPTASPRAAGGDPRSRPPGGEGPGGSLRFSPSAGNGSRGAHAGRCETHLCAGGRGVSGGVAYPRQGAGPFPHQVVAACSLDPGASRAAC